MNKPPQLLRWFLLLALVVVIIGTAYASVRFVIGSATAREDTAIVAKTFKQLVVEKTLEEYNRWHQNGTLRETHPDAAAILKNYWKLGSIPVTENNLRNSSWQYRHPWSAVFISWVMLQAGAGNQFPYSNNHAKYIVWARDNAALPNAVFTAYDVKDERAAWPEPGDLVCMNRRSNRFTLQSINRNCISHCDIVVEVNKEAGYLVAIGGNVGQTVNKRIVFLDANGLIDQSRNWRVDDLEEENPEGSQKDFFGIIRVKQQ